MALRAALALGTRIGQALSKAPLGKSYAMRSKDLFKDVASSCQQVFPVRAVHTDERLCARIGEAIV